MKLESLPASNETKARKRVGRGPGSGMGKTSTRGEKGQKARSGASISAWFQGGQTPIYRRIPKRGFNNARFETKYATINLADLDKYFNDGDVVTPEVLKERGIVKKQLSGVKVLANGELSKKLTVKATRFSSTAVTKIENAGGKAEVI
ncbi:MAG: 50S ribosomal protein L15 [Bacilli bacterium]|jgi:large subunit ribosomal protein L15|nr:50S ribosomal protein L15 [Bacilli bacterium]MCX4254599.1 50S ribosomal protein L15 [Bacilli bacterium]